MTDSGAYVVSWSLANKNGDPVLIVGKEINGKREIINAFSGQEAIDIWNLLTNVKEKKE